MKTIETESYNSINIIGKVVDMTVRTGTTSTNKPYESINLVIRVNQDIEGKVAVNEIPVSFFASPYTNSGKENPMYKYIQDMKKAKTIQTHGLSEADTVRLSKANLRENYFVSRNNGQLIDGWQIRGAFFNNAKEGAKETATFSVDAFILDMRDEVNSDGDTTGRLIIKGAVVQYGGSVDVFDFIVEDSDKIDYLQRMLEPGQTFRIGGRIRYTQEEVQRSASSGWGETFESDSTRTVRELIVTGGGEAPYDEDFAYDPDEIKKALNARKARMEQAQIDAKNNGDSAKKAAAATAKPGKYDWE